MLRKKIIISVILLGLITGCRNPFAPERIEVKGTVHDSNGVGISGVAISLSPEVTPSVLTDSNGNYILLSVRPGEYDLKAKKTGFPDQSKKITVESTSGLSCYDPEKLIVPVIDMSKTDITAPTVTSTTPINNASNISVNSSITATFSEVMDSTSLNTNTFTLNGGATGTVTYTGTIATLKPSANLAYNTTYTATITTGATDKAGNPLSSNYTWNFKTSVAMDTTAPLVSSVNPENSAINVAITNTKITVTFNETMDASIFTSSTFIVNTGGNNISGTLSYSGTTATFTPLTDLVYGTEYTATITTDVKDSSGNKLASNYSWKFTTRASEIIEFSGTGDKVLEKTALSGGTAIFTMTHDGSSYFIVTLNDKNAQEISTIIDTFGSYSGEKLASIPSADDYILEIEADGNWTIKIKN